MVQAAVEGREDVEEMVVAAQEEAAPGVDEGIPLVVAVETPLEEVVEVGNRLVVAVEAGNHPVVAVVGAHPRPGLAALMPAAKEVEEAWHLFRSQQVV